MLQKNHHHRRRSSRSHHHHHHGPHRRRRDKSNHGGDTEGHSRWWHSSFHVIASMVGAGILGLPRAFAMLTWAGGIVSMIAAFAVTLASAYFLSFMHFFGEERVKNFPELGQRLFGIRLGPGLIMPMQIIVIVGTCIAYIILSGQLAGSLDRVFGAGVVSQTGWFCVFTVFQLVLALVPNLEKLRWLSFFAVVASCGYSFLVMILCAVLGPQPGIHFASPETDPALMARGAMEALGSVAFAFGGHSVMVEVQATMAHGRQGEGTMLDARREMFKGVVAAYVLVAVLYFGVAIAGYLTFGAAVPDDVLVELAKVAPSRVFSDVVALAQVLVYVHIVFAFQVYSQLIFLIIERRWPIVQQSNMLLGRALRRWPLVLAEWLVSAALPFFGDLTGFVGAIATTAMTFVYPCVLYLLFVRAGHASLPLWAIALIGIVAVVYSVIGLLGGAASLWSLVTRKESFSFFQ